MTVKQRKGRGADTGNAGHFASVPRSETAVSSDSLSDTLAEMETLHKDIVAADEDIARANAHKERVFSKMSQVMDRWADEIPDPSPGEFFDDETADRMAFGSARYNSRRCAERLDEAAQSLNPALRFNGAVAARNQYEAIPTFSADVHAIATDDQCIALAGALQKATGTQDRTWYERTEGSPEHPPRPMLTVSGPESTYAVNGTTVENIFEVTSESGPSRLVKRLDDAVFEVSCWNDEDLKARAYTDDAYGY